MNLKGIELTAILSAGMFLSNADGRLDDSEKEILIKELGSFNVTEDEAEIYLKVAIDLSVEQTVEILKAMSDDAKKYACGYLGAVMICDGDVDDKEMEAWRAFCGACDFPTMTLGEAIEFWRNN
jgi:tellurite resistance protein